MNVKVTSGQAARIIRSDLAPVFMQELGELAQHLNPGLPALAFALLLDAQRARASDLHFEPRTTGTRLRFRIDGVLSDVADLSPEQGRVVLNQFKAVADLDPVVHFITKDTRATIELDGAALDVRLALAPCHHGEALVVRLLDPKRLERSLGELGLSPRQLTEIEDWLDHVSGMFLTAGPTGSGKTTTIYALLHKLKLADRAIVSIEDPVEYQINGITQIKIDELHHVDFAEAVKSVLRLDPDYVMMGEIRDAMSAHSALNAAISGRVLLSTLHSRDAVGAVTALRNWGLLDHEIAEVLGVVVAQRLVRRLCPHCRHKVTPSASDTKWLDLMKLAAPASLWSADGCKDCQNLGYSGRTGVFDLWRLDGEDYDLIMNHANEHTLRERLARKSHENLLGDAFAKALDGTTSLAEIRKSCGISLPQRSGPDDATG
jgi:type II secretory ATPase GspE/PulE/Tfp pilus assembly ATPase PilB-like protein